MRDTYFISEIMLIRIASGDRDAFRSFYDIIYPQVYRFIHYFLPNKADCEEVVSDVFFIITLFTVLIIFTYQARMLGRNSH